MTTQVWAVLIGSYLLGSIPSAYIAARLVLGKDIWQLGDGNMGAKNTFHSVGKVAGALVAGADIGKGALAVQMARSFHLSDNVVLLAGACAVLGHDFPLLVRFRGGQGMATMIGVFGLLFPTQTVLALIALAVTLAITRNWDLSCGVGFVFLVGATWLAGQPLKRALYPVVLLPTIGLRKLLQTWQARRATISS